MVFQKPILLNRSVETNLAFVLNPVKKTPQEKKKIITEALKKIKLLEKIKFAARSLSQGEQQKLAIIRSAILSPEIIFLDEPTSNIDPQATIEIEQLIMDISRGGSQVVMSTHNIKQAERIAGGIIFMSQGRILKDTSSEDFFLKDQCSEIQQFLNNI
jgi:tungstate transport system ATP-binding protein